MSLYKVQLTSDKTDYIYIGTSDPSLIGDNYPNAVSIIKIDSLTILS